MEISPLRFLDFDTSQKLSKDVRNSQENEARKFHSNLFEENLDINRSNHYLISNVFEKLSTDFILNLYEHKYPIRYQGPRCTTVDQICWHYESYV